MTIKNSRAQRRHDRARLKKKRQYHWGYGHVSEWIGRTPDVAGEINYMSPATAGIVVNTPTPCSCYMCGNPRRNSWGESPLTMQERKAEESYADGVEEYNTWVQDWYWWEGYDYCDDYDYGDDPADDKHLKWMYIKGSPMVECECCGKQGEGYKQFWSMYDYYGINGWICVKCYDKVEHDKDGNPKNPLHGVWN